ncbi:hypothetical protein IJU22_01535 [Candidatus Saccharibacteria bacterium]|nr:hypothetical protein [Candidatus Saccharibacteria bacterium]
MDPKQTEGQNSGPGNAPAGGFSFSSEPNNTTNNPGANPSVLSTGAKVTRAIADLNSSRKSATQNSPFAKHQFQKVAPRTGDILIDPSGNIITEEPKKGINRGRLIQFGLIFGGIALVALVIFTVVMVINNKPKDTKKATPVALSYQEAFNRYANWMISGEDSTEEPANIDEFGPYYYAYAIFEQTDGRIDYVKTAKDYYDAFYSAFSNSELASYINLSSTVEASNDNLTFYLSYLEDYNFSDDDLLEKYLGAGSELKNELNGIYDVLAEQGDSASDFVEFARQRGGIIVDWFDLLNSNNCIIDETIDYTCQSKLLNSSAPAKEMNQKLNTLKTSMDRSISVITNQLILSVSTIYSEMQQPTEEETYSEAPVDVPPEDNNTESNTENNIEDNTEGPENEES